MGGRGPSPVWRGHRCPDAEMGGDLILTVLLGYCELIVQIWHGCCNRDSTCSDYNRTIIYVQWKIKQNVHHGGLPGLGGGARRPLRGGASARVRKWEERGSLFRPFSTDILSCLLRFDTAVALAMPHAALSHAPCDMQIESTRNPHELGRNRRNRLQNREFHVNTCELSL